MMQTPRRWPIHQINIKKWRKRKMRTKKLNNTIAMLRDYKESNELTYEELQQRTGIHAMTLNGWLTGKVIPLDTSIERVQNFLNTVYARQFVEIAEADKTYIDSRLVAQWIGKAHRHLLQDIRNYIEDLKRLSDEYKGGVENPATPEKARDNNPFAVKYYFMESSYIHPQNKTEYPCYLVSKLGCEMIAHKMTGLKGTKFTALYINEFHRMKDNEQAEQTPKIESEQCLSYEVLEDTPREEKDLKYIRNRLMEVARTADLDSVVHELVVIAKIVNAMRDDD